MLVGFSRRPETRLDDLTWAEPDQPDGMGARVWNGASGVPNRSKQQRHVAVYAMVLGPMDYHLARC